MGVSVVFEVWLLWVWVVVWRSEGRGVGGCMCSVYSIPASVL